MSVNEESELKWAARTIIRLEQENRRLRHELFVVRSAVKDSPLVAHRVLRKLSETKTNPETGSSKTILPYPDIRSFGGQ